MLTITKAHVEALIGSVAPTGCSVLWLKDRMLRFKGSLKLNRELTYNPLVQRTVTALGRGRQPLSRIVNNLSRNDPMVKAIVEQTLYALVNAEFVNVERDGEETVLEAKNRQKVVELLSGSRMEGETRPLAGYVWLRNQSWMEDPHFPKDERRLGCAVEVPFENVDPSSEASRKEIERLVLQQPPYSRFFGEVHGVEEQRNEVLEKAGLLNVKMKVVGADVENAEFIEEFWVSQCLVFLGIPDTCGCVVRMLRPPRDERRNVLRSPRDERRNVFEAAVQQIVEKNEIFRGRLTRSENVEIT